MIFRMKTNRYSPDLKQMGFSESHSRTSLSSHRNSCSRKRQGASTSVLYTLHIKYNDIYYSERPFIVDSAYPFRGWVGTCAEDLAIKKRI